jgi:hypothetical protein
MVNRIARYVMSVVAVTVCCLVSTASAQRSPGAVYQSSLDRLVSFEIRSDGHLFDKFWNGSIAPCGSRPATK